MPLDLCDSCKHAWHGLPCIVNYCRCPSSVNAEVRDR